MAADQQSGAYKMTSFTFTPGPVNSVLVQVNFEGTGQGYTALFTGTFVVGKSGTYSLCGALYLDNGDITPFTSQGMYESSGHHTWRTHHLSQLSDGRTNDVEGEIDLAARTYTTKYVERS
jgi:hypothetical protein